MCDERDDNGENDECDDSHDPNLTLVTDTIHFFFQNLEQPENINRN
jgi:hypothetical protein